MSTHATNGNGPVGSAEPSAGGTSLGRGTRPALFPPVTAPPAHPDACAAAAALRPHAHQDQPHTAGGVRDRGATLHTVRQESGPYTRFTGVFNK